MATTKIYYKRDFKSAISLASGSTLTPFCFTYTSGKFGFRKYVASWDGTTYKNCMVSDDGTRIIVMFDDHRMAPGPIRVIRNWEWTDPEMPTGKYNTADAVDTGIVLTTNPEDVPSDEESESVTVEDEVLLNMLKGEKGDTFTYEDLTDANKEDLLKPLTETMNGRMEAIEETASADHDTAVADHNTAVSDHEDMEADKQTYAQNEADRQAEYTENITTFKETVEKVYDLDEYIDDMEQIKDDWDKESAKMEQTNTAVQEAIKNGLGTATDYGFLFMEEAALDNMTSTSMLNGILYCGMESLGTSSVEFTAGVAICSDVEFEDGIAMVNGIEFTNGLATLQ